MEEAAGFLEHDGVSLAWRRVEGAGPTVVWLGGFHSEMTGTKAEALAAWARSAGREFLRFDYFGMANRTAPSWTGPSAAGGATPWRCLTN